MAPSLTPFSPKFKVVSLSTDCAGTSARSQDQSHRAGAGWFNPVVTINLSRCRETPKSA